MGTKSQQVYYKYIQWETSDDLLLCPSPYGMANLFQILIISSTEL